MGASEDLTRLRQLWKLGFGDDDEWIDSFFSHYHTEKCCFTRANAQGLTVAQMHALPLDGGGVYIYGVTTPPEWRGQGHAASMIADALAQLSQRGVSFAMLIAAGPELWPWYEEMGFVKGDEKPVEVTGYDGECLCNDAPDLNRALWRVVNVRSYLRLYASQHQGKGLDKAFYLADTIEGNTGTYMVDGSFLPGERLAGVPELHPDELLTAFPLDLPRHMTVVDPRDALL